MRASRGGSLALPAFLGPTHENLFLTSTLPPFWPNPARRLELIWPGKTRTGRQVYLPGTLSPGRSRPEDTTSFRLGLADPRRNPRTAPGATPMTAAQRKGQSPVVPWVVRNGTGSPGLSACPGLPQGFAFGPSTWADEDVHEEYPLQELCPWRPSTPAQYGCSHGILVSWRGSRDRRVGRLGHRYDHGPPSRRRGQHNPW